MTAKKQYKSAPDFTASDTTDHLITLSEYKGSKNVMLVFNRGFQ